MPDWGRALIAVSAAAIVMAGCGISVPPSQTTPTPIDALAPDATSSPSLTPGLTPSIEFTASPTRVPTATSQPPLINGGALPPGALTRIGIGYINTSAVAPDGSLVALGTSTGIYVYEVDGLKPLWRRYTSACDFIQWSPDGTRFITGNAGLGSSSMWDARSGIKLATLEGAWYGGEFSADGSKIVAMHTPELDPQPDSDFLDSRIIIYDGFTGAALQSITLPDTNLINSVKWVNGDTGLVAADTWDAPMDYEKDVFLVKLGPPVSVAPLPTEPTNALTEKIEVSPNGKVLAWSREGSPSTFWDMSTGLQLAEFQPVGGEISWSPDSTRLIELIGYSPFYEGVSMWDVATQTVDWSFEDRFAREILAWSPDQSRIAILSGSEVKVIDSGTGEVVASTPLSKLRGLIFVSYEPTVKVNWLADNRTLVINDAQNLFTWDVQTAQVVNGFNSNAIFMYGVAWLADGDTVVILTGEGFGVDTSYQAWSASTGQPVQATIPDQQLRRIYADIDKEISPDGKYKADGLVNWPIIEGPFPELFFDEYRSGLQIIDAQTNTILFEFRSTTHSFGQVAWSPDSRLLAVGPGGLGGFDYNLHVPGETITGGPDDGIAIFDAPNLKLLGFLPNASSGTWLAFSPDGLKLASASYDGTVIIWQITY